MKIDVIIPVYNRVDTLEMVLQSIAHQEIPKESSLGVIIVNDASQENVVTVGEKYGAIVITHKKRLGSAHARNTGTSASNADIVLFLGADIILKPGAVKAHIDFHKKSAQTALGLGFVQWDPVIIPSPFEEWMTHGGPQNNFDELLGKEKADIKHFCFGSHISMKRSLALQSPFPEKYSSYGWEDLELGRSIEKIGGTLYVLHRAGGLHHHKYSVSAIKRRQLQSGAMFTVFAQRNNLSQAKSASVARKIKHKLFRYTGAYFVMVSIVRVFSKKSFPHVYQLLTAHWFYQGVWAIKRLNKANNSQ